jgi:hypothetical protein
VVRNRALGFLDSLFTLLFGCALLLLALGWIAVVAPFQYFVTLVAGAPARSAALSLRMWVKRSGKTVELFKVPAELVAEGMEEVGLASRPVTVTSAIAAGLLFVTNLLV